MVNVKEIIEDPLAIAQAQAVPQTLLWTATTSMVGSVDGEAVLASPRSDIRSKKSKSDMKDWEIRVETAIDERRAKRIKMFNFYNKSNKGKYDTVASFVKDTENTMQLQIENIRGFQSA